MMSWDALGYNNRKPPSVYIGSQSPGGLFFLHFLSLSVSSDSNTMKKDSLHRLGKSEGRPKKKEPPSQPRGEKAEFTLAGTLPGTDLRGGEAKAIWMFSE